MEGYFLQRYSILFSLATSGFLYRLRDRKCEILLHACLLYGLWTEEINRALTNREPAVMASRSSSRSDKSKVERVREDDRRRTDRQGGMAGTGE